MSYSLRHAKQTTDPETILIAAENLQNSHKHICKAFCDLNGDAKAELVDRYIKLSDKVYREILDLEHDYTVLMSRRYGLSISSIPFFGPAENMATVREHYNRVIAGRNENENEKGEG